MNIDDLTLKCFRQSTLFLLKDSGWNLPGSLSSVWNWQEHPS